MKVSRGAITILAKSGIANPLLDAFEEARADARKAGTDGLTMKQINAIVAKSRKETRTSDAKRTK